MNFLVKVILERCGVFCVLEISEKCELEKIKLVSSKSIDMNFRDKSEASVF